MKTLHTMTRYFEEYKIRQDTDGMFNVQDIIDAFNERENSNKRLDHFWENNKSGLVRFLLSWAREERIKIDVLETKFGVDLSKNLNSGFNFSDKEIKDISAIKLAKAMKVYKTSRRKGEPTKRVSGVLMLKIAGWLSPEFESLLYSMAWDGLIKVRHFMGDNTQKFTDAIMKRFHGYYGERAYERFMNKANSHLLGLPPLKYKTNRVRDVMTEDQLLVADKVFDQMAVLLDEGYVVTESGFDQALSNRPNLVNEDGINLGDYIREINGLS
ncbi:KilA-N domain-containing protein [Endozoicomonas sp. ALB115]|uniref:KilA-N domain-containing protein n=1 Tax=Endozoicomonas sp. ALB115 TaxID=3403074 RepID=UPI003BB5D70F